MLRSSSLLQNSVVMMLRFAVFLFCVLQLSKALEAEQPSIDKTKLEQNGYKLLLGYGFYKLNKDRKPWGQAAEKCREEGAHLLILNSDDEAIKVSEFVDLKNMKGSSDCWTGIHDNFIEGHYETIFFKPLNTTGFTKWRKGKPNNKKSMNCVDFGFKSKTDYGLGNFDCSKPDEFICEMELF